MALRYATFIYNYNLPAPPSANFALPLKPSPYESLPPNPIILDIGAKNERAKCFGAPPPGARNICTDVQPGPGVDIVADAQNMPQLPLESPHRVFLVSDLQYIPSPQKAIAEVFRVLRPGGIFYVNVPFIFFLAEDPVDLYRSSSPGLEFLRSRFERIASGSRRRLASTFCDRLIRFIGILFSFNSDAPYAVTVYCGKWMLFWIKYLDIVIQHFSTADILGGNPYFLGRKPLHSTQSSIERK